MREISVNNDRHLKSNFSLNFTLISNGNLFFQFIIPKTSLEELIVPSKSIIASVPCPKPEPETDSKSRLKIKSKLELELELEPKLVTVGIQYGHHCLIHSETASSPVGEALQEKNLDARLKIQNTVFMINNKMSFSNKELCLLG